MAKCKALTGSAVKGLTLIGDLRTYSVITLRVVETSTNIKKWSR